MNAITPVPRIFTLMPWHLWTSGRWRLDTLSRCIGDRPIGAVRAGPRLFRVVRDAEVAGRILVDNAANYRKRSPSYVALRPLLGNGLFLTEGESWLKQRRLAQPAFHRKRLETLVASMVGATAEMIDRWDDLAARGTVFDVAAEMIRLTLTVVGRALMSVDLTDVAGEMGRALELALHETDRRVLSPIPLPTWLPLPRNRRFNRAIHSIDANVESLVRSRRAAATSGERAPEDLLSMLMSARDEETGEALSDAELRDEVKTLLLAGHETTASALAWTWAFLGSSPEGEARLHAEVDGVLGGRRPGSADLLQLHYASMLTQEAMRLYPPVWIIEREAVANDVLAGHFVPAGGNVTIVTYLLHRNPSYWTAPDRFDPDRFSPERDHARPRFSYMPFGAGQRICIGQHFAMMEAQVILAMVAQRYRVVLDPGHELDPRLAIVMRTNGVRARLERRPAYQPA
jgi:cytochrome P450